MPVCVYAYIYLNVKHFTPWLVEYIFWNLWGKILKIEKYWRICALSLFARRSYQIFTKFSSTAYSNWLTGESCYLHQPDYNQELIFQHRSDAFYLQTCALLFDSLFLVCSNSYCHLHSVFSPMQVCCAWLHRGLDKFIKSTPKISHSCWRSFLWFDFQWFDPQGLYIQQRTAGDPNKLREGLLIFLQRCCLQHVRIQYYLQVGHVYSNVRSGSCLQQYYKGTCLQ